MDARLPSSTAGGPRAPASFYCPISMVGCAACIPYQFCCMRAAALGNYQSQLHHDSAKDSAAHGLQKVVLQSLPWPAQGGSIFICGM